MDIKTYVATKIKQYRKEKGLTQKELGEKIGVKHNTISGYEKGTTEPEQNLLFMIAKALDISINDLFPETRNCTTLHNNLEIDLINNFRMLNEKGQNVASDAVKSFTLNPDFTALPQEKARGKGA